MENSLFPYFQIILDQIEKGNRSVEEAVGTHAHWGYWENPDSANGTLADFRKAADALTLEHLKPCRKIDGGKTLDAGCGFGGTLGFINQHFENADLVGLNIDAPQIERASRQITPLTRKGNKIQFIKGDACQPPFESESFDQILTVECIFHFPSRERYFQEAFRMLKPGGRLVVTDFLIYGPGIPILLALKPFQPDFESFYGRVSDPVMLSGYRKLAKTVGFRTVLERDISHEVMPTFSAHKKLFGGLNIGDLFRQTNEFLEKVFRLRVYRYYLLVFEKPR